MRLTSLDGLRGLAALVVVFSHYTGLVGAFGGLLVGLGQAGVMIFFVLSGYLMGTLYMQRPISTTGIAEFYVRRMARVAPLYLVLVVAAWYFLDVWVIYNVNDDNLWEHLLFIKGHGVLWTVAVEVQFYALFPLFWWMFARLGAFGFIPMLTICAIAYWLQPLFPVAILGPTLTYFVAGMILATIKLPYSRAIEPLFILLLALMVLTTQQLLEWLGLPPITYWYSPVFMLIVPALVFVSVQSKLAAIFLGSRPMIYFGSISYSLYLLHLPVYYSLHRYLSDQPIFLVLTASVATVIAASASYYFFEKPVRESLTAVFAQRHSAAMTSSGSAQIAASNASASGSSA